MKDTINVISYMRRRMNLTQLQIAKSTGLTPNDISRLERGIIKIQMKKFITLSKYFRIPLEALLFNNLTAALLSFKEPTVTSRKMPERIKAMRERQDDIGYKGEHWVYQQEIKKLKGTIYENGVNPNYADDGEAHFDILSFQADGSSILIEVKTTTGNAEDAFFISNDELNKAKECLVTGEKYEIHRVYHINEPKKRGRYIISAEQLLSDYQFVPETYKVLRKVRY